MRNKLEFIKVNFLDFDIICLTETHLSDNVLNEHLSLEGYGQIYRKDINAHSGGLLIYTSVSLISNQIHDLETLLPESIWVEVKDHSHSYLILQHISTPSFF